MLLQLDLFEESYLIPFYEIKYDFVINCAGVFADVIAKFFDIGSNYSILPFKGTYKKLRKAKTHLVNGSIYPVPDLNNPFLGVHLTKNVKGEVNSDSKNTITELVYIPNEIQDGFYFVNIQLPHFKCDAAPSRPILMKPD